MDLFISSRRSDAQVSSLRAESVTQVQDLANSTSFANRAGNGRSRLGSDADPFYGGVTICAAGPFSWLHSVAAAMPVRLQVMAYLRGLAGGDV